MKLITGSKRSDTVVFISDPVFIFHNQQFQKVTAAIQ